MSLFKPNGSVRLGLAYRLAVVLDDVRYLGARLACHLGRHGSSCYGHHSLRTLAQVPPVKPPEPPPVRPRRGTITHENGDVEPVWFVTTDEPGRFAAVTVGGRPVPFRPGDRLHVDVLGAGQSIAMPTS